MKKYELTTEFITVFGIKLFRIKAIRAFGNVEAGELGGFVEKEENLSHNGDAWVYGDAGVYGNAGVSGDAWVLKKTHLFQVGALGSRNRFTTFFRTKNKEIFVTCGCFEGNIDKFEKAVEETHGGTKHEQTYKTAIALAKLQIDLED